MNDFNSQEKQWEYMLTGSTSGHESLAAPITKIKMLWDGEAWHKVIPNNCDVTKTICDIDKADYTVAHFLHLDNAYQIISYNAHVIRQGVDREVHNFHFDPSAILHPHIHVVLDFIGSLFT